MMKYIRIENAINAIITQIYKKIKIQDFPLSHNFFFHPSLSLFQAHHFNDSLSMMKRENENLLHECERARKRERTV